MIVRCGRCGSRFEAPGEGRYSCPSCGTANEVVRRRDPESDIVMPPSRPAAEEPSSPRVTCPECGFRFIVGDVETATCPMCGAAVAVDAAPSDTEQSEET